MPDPLQSSRFARLRARREFLIALASAGGLLSAAAALGDRLRPRSEELPAPATMRIEPGEPAPRVEVPLLGGGTWSTSALEGRPAWINVWASWCPPCRTEMPDIDEVARTGSAAGLAFLALNFREDRRVAERYLENTGYRFAVGLDITGDIAGAFNIVTLPAHVFIGRDGRLASVHVGGMTRAEMESRVRAVIGAPEPQAP